MNGQEKPSSLIPRHPFFAGFDDIFNTPFFTNDFGTAPSFFTDMDRHANGIAPRAYFPRLGEGMVGRGYEISENEKEFRLAMDVPGVKAADIKLQLEGGEGSSRKVIHLSGERKFQRGDTTTESKFKKSITIDDTSVDTSKITANLADGVLVLTAPKKNEKPTSVQAIPITEQPHAHL
uniref:Heat shock protein 20 n=1 Tax=Ditylum brightwellii TaxID=49249 RepID=T1P716_9STRA|nr:heat shock protein 20 [Ditylum brightwellii]